MSRLAILLILGAWLGRAAEGGATQTPGLRVLSFNVLLGFSADKANALQWIASQRPDVVGLQELKGYTEAQLREEARAWGHSHVVLGEERFGLQLGLTSREPIEVAHSISRSGIRLGMLHGRIRGIDIFVLHLGHGTDDIRRRETEIVLEEIRKIESAHRPSLLLGDFNSISRHDREFYERNNVMTDAGRLYRRNDKGFAILNLDTMDQYRGWVDVVHQHQGELTKDQASWPSKVYANNRNYVRVDYILASAPLARTCHFARVMKDPATDHLSDHYPVMADFQWPRQLRAALVNPAMVSEQRLTDWRSAGYNAITLELRDANRSIIGSPPGAQAKTAAEAIQLAGFDLYYWIEIARNQAMANAHPEWMCSLQGHKDWRQRFEGSANPQKGEVVKVYPWVPILYKETFAAHLRRVKKLLADLPGATGVFLNDLQGGPSACGCGSQFCRWTSDYGSNLTATPYSKNPKVQRHFPGAVDAAAHFVHAVKELVPETEVIPVWLTECEEHDRPGICGKVGCYRGYCWQYYEQQLEQLIPESKRLGALALYKALGRDLPEYQDKAGWISWVLASYSALPPKRTKKMLSPHRLLPILQGWDVTDAEIAAQIQRAEEARAGGYVLSLIEIDQSWEPRILHR
jgi:exonuclease III